MYLMPLKVAGSKYASFHVLQSLEVLMEPAFVTLYGPATTCLRAVVKDTATREDLMLSSYLKPLDETTLCRHIPPNLLNHGFIP